MKWHPFQNPISPRPPFSEDKKKRAPLFFPENLDLWCRFPGLRTANNLEYLQYIIFIYDIIGYRYYDLVFTLEFFLLLLYVKKTFLLAV